MAKPSVDTTPIGRNDANDLWKTWVNRIKADFPKFDEMGHYDQREYANIEDASSRVCNAVLGMQECLFAHNAVVYETFKQEYYHLKSKPWQTTKLGLSSAAFYRLFQPLTDKILRVAASNGWTQSE